MNKIFRRIGIFVCLYLSWLSAAYSGELFDKFIQYRSEALVFKSKKRHKIMDYYSIKFSNYWTNVINDIPDKNFKYPGTDNLYVEFVDEIKKGFGALQVKEVRGFGKVSVLNVIFVNEKDDWKISCFFRDSLKEPKKINEIDSFFLIPCTAPVKPVR